MKNLSTNISLFALLLSFIACIVSITALTTSSEISSITQQASPTTTEQIPSSATATYTNNDLRLQFSYPANYQISEEHELAGDTGKLLRINVTRNNEALFTVTATSSNYDPSAGEGTMSFAGSLDIKNAPQEAERIVGEQLGKIFAPYRRELDNQSSMGFFYAPIQYGAVDIFESHIVSATHNNTYSTISFTSGSLYHESGTEEELAQRVNDILTLKNLRMGDDFYNELSLEKRDAYNRILESVLLAD